MGNDSNYRPIFLINSVCKILTSNSKKIIRIDSYQNLFIKRDTQTIRLSLDLINEIYSKINEVIDIVSPRAVGRN